jgi:predicted site-specific integrase-resolvase
VGTGARVSYSAALRWFKSGKLPVPVYQADRLIVIGEPASISPSGITAVDARVSSSDQAGDLDRQVAGVTAWASRNGLVVGRVLTEVGSALNGKRRQFLALPS